MSGLLTASHIISPLKMSKFVPFFIQIKVIIIHIVYLIITLCHMTLYFFVITEL